MVENALYRRRWKCKTTLEAAQYIIKTVAVDALGARRAASLSIDLDSEAPALRDVWDAVQSFGGWQALIKRGANRLPVWPGRLCRACSIDLKAPGKG